MQPDPIMFPMSQTDREDIFWVFADICKIGFLTLLETSEMLMLLCQNSKLTTDSFSEEKKKKTENTSQKTEPDY